MKYTTMGDYSKYPKLEKSRVKAHQRRTKTGKIVQVREHEVSGHKGYHHKEMKKLTGKQHGERYKVHDEQWEKNAKEAVKHYNKGDKKKAFKYGAKARWHQNQATAHDTREDEDKDMAKISPKKHLKHNKDIIENEIKYMW